MPTIVPGHTGNTNDGREKERRETNPPRTSWQQYFQSEIIVIPVLEIVVPLAEELVQVETLVVVKHDRIIVVRHALLLLE